MLINKKAIEANGGREFEFRYGTESAKVRLRLCPGIKDAEFVKRHTSTDIVRGLPQEKTDWGAVEDDRTDYCIVSWSGINTDDGSGPVPLPCTRENKLWLIKNLPAFGLFVKSYLSLMTTGKVLMTEEEEKNFEPSPVGTGSTGESAADTLGGQSLSA
jgi:hypothetical protein